MQLSFKQQKQIIHWASIGVLALLMIPVIDFLSNKTDLLTHHLIESLITMVLLLMLIHGAITLRLEKIAVVNHEKQAMVFLAAILLLLKAQDHKFKLTKTINDKGKTTFTVTTTDQAINSYTLRVASLTCYLFIKQSKRLILTQKNKNDLFNIWLNNIKPNLIQSKKDQLWKQDLKLAYEVSNQLKSELNTLTLMLYECNEISAILLYVDSVSALKLESIKMNE